MKTKTEGKRKAPDFSGVPGEIVSLEGLTLKFGGRKTSPYDALLDQLAKATEAALADGKPAPGLKFGDAKARASVYARAKGKGLKVAFAELAGVLYVRIDGDAIEGRKTAIRKILATGNYSHIEIAAKLRDGGDQHADGSGVSAILSKMQKAGEVVLQEGGKWKQIKKPLAVAS